MTPIRSVVFLTYHFPPEVGGIQTRISKYIEKLPKRGVRVKVLVAGSHPETARFKDAKVAVCPGGMGHFPRNAVLVASIVIRSQADVVHVFTGASTLLGVYSLVVARLVRAKPVVSFFGREDFAFAGIASRALFCVATSLATSIDVNSAATGALLPPKLRGKVHVLLGAAEESGSTAGQGPDDGSAPAELLFVGRLVERKGVDDLLRAFAIMKPGFPEARLSIVGAGPERDKLIELAAQLDVSGSVDFKGKRLGADLDREYEGCVAVVLPSKDVPSDPANEGLGLTLIEASMHAKPIIGTRHGGIPEVVRQGENGLLVPPGDPASLAHAMGEILSDRDRARAMGETALRMARSRFSWERATDTLLESYV